MDHHQQELEAEPISIRKGPPVVGGSFLRLLPVFDVALPETVFGGGSRTMRISNPLDVRMAASSRRSVSFSMGRGMRTQSFMSDSLLSLASGRPAGR